VSIQQAVARSVAVVLPDMIGASGALVVAWLAASGERVDEGHPLVDLEIGETRISVPAPASGTLSNVAVGMGEQVAAAATLAWVDTDEPVVADARALIDRMESVDDPGRALVGTLLDIVECDNPELADLVRVCAIPAKIDPHVVTLLIGVDEERARELLSKLREFQFVRTRADGRYSYEHSTREELLRQWRQPNQRHRFVELNRRMWKYQESELARAREMEVDLRRIGPVVRLVNPNRYAQLADKVEGRIRKPMLEVIYHAAMVSSRDLYRVFVEFVQEMESRGLLLLCQALLHATRNQMQDVDPDSENLIWLDYWEGRLLQELREGPEAERILGGVVNRTRDGEMVKQWALADLGRLRYGQYRLGEASKLFRRELRLAKDTRVDLINLSTSCVRLAGLESLIGDYEAAIEHYREALSFSDTLPEPNPVAEVAAWEGLGQALDRVGQSKEAIEAAFTAVYTARTKLRSEQNFQVMALGGLANILASSDARISATLYAEAEALTEDDDNTQQASEHRLRYIEALIEKGRSTAARELLRAMRETEPGQHRLDGELTLLEAMLAAAKGNSIEAADRLTRLLGREQSQTEWQRWTAITQRGLFLTACGRWREAEDDLVDAFRCWWEAGSTDMMATCKIALADLGRRRGDLTGAEAALKAADRFLAGRNGETAARFYRTRSDLLRALGRAEEADFSSQEAIRRYKILGRIPLLLEATLHSAQCAADSTAWAETAKAATRAARLSRQLDELDRWSPSTAEREAARANTRGARLLTEDRVNAERAASQAVDFFARATRADRENPWYLLNLSCANALLNRWDQAVRAAQLAVTHSGALPAAPLRAHLLEYLLQQSETLAQGRDDRAASIIAQAAGVVDETTSTRQRIAVARVRGDVSLLSLPLDTRSAEAAYSDGLKLAEQNSRRLDEASFLVRRAVVAAQDRDISACASSLESALGALSDFSEDERATRLLSSCMAVLTTPDQYRTFSAALAFIDGSRKPAEAWLRHVLLRLAERWYQKLTGIDESTAVADNEPSCPVKVEADETLFFGGSRTPALARLLERDIPALRERLRKETGVTLPTVSMIAVPVDTPGAYTVKLHGTSVAWGQVEVDSLFCGDLQKARAAGLDGLRAVDPVTGADGVWLADSARRDAEKRDLSLLDVPGFLLRHLDSLVREALPALIGVDDMRRMVEDIPTEDGDDGWKGLLRSPDGGARIRLLVSIVHALIDEGVPIHDPAVIVRIVESVPAVTTPAAVVAAVRLALRDDLPGWRRPGVFLRFRPEIEATLTAGMTRESESRLALAPGDAEALRRIVQIDLSVASPVRALLVADSAVRPFVRRLLGSRLPGVAVLSDAEVSFRTPVFDATTAGGVDT
jgi:tetratricopeptide (TPR) repeat protein